MEYHDRKHILISTRKWKISFFVVASNGIVSFVAQTPTVISFSTGHVYDFLSGTFFGCKMYLWL